MTTREQLDAIAQERIIILDGAMGSLIQVLNLDEKSYRGDRFAEHPTPLLGCNDVLCLTRPGAIGAIHDTYLEAGADIIETCSFNSTSIVLADYGLGHLAYEISKASAEVARKSADKFAHVKPRFVAGSVGPTNKGASLYPDVNDPGKRSIGWDELEAAYYDNARGLLDGGADLLLVGTIFDTLNAKAALFAINRVLEERNIDVPIMISASISGEGRTRGSGRLLSGQGLEAFLISVLHAKPWAVGLNCSFNASVLLPHLQVLSRLAPCLISAYPNAGLPNQFGRYDETPDIMSANIEPFLKDGFINIIGGCCGSSPAHIAAIAGVASGYAPRKIPDCSKTHAGFGINFSGLEPLYIENKTVHLQNDENPKDREDFLKALSDGEYEDAADIARDMIEGGCKILNIKTDDENAITSFLNYALMNPYIAKAPFFINSSDFNVLQTGLKRLQGRGFAGPISLNDGETEFLRKANIIRQFGAVVVVASDNEQKNETAQKVYQLLQKNGFSVNDTVITCDADYINT